MCRSRHFGLGVYTTCFGIWTRIHNVSKTNQEQQNKARGAKYLTFELSGSKNHALDGCWSEKPKMLGTWTPWKKKHDMSCPPARTREQHLRRLHRPEDAQLGYNL